MALLGWELRKIWRPALLAAIALIGLVFWQIRTGFYIEHLGSGWEDEIGLTNRWLEEYGVTIEPAERAELDGQLAEAKALATKITEARRAAAKRLEAEIVRELAELDMEKVKMRIAVHTGTKLSAHGFDTVTFEISVNPGEPEKPLSKVASGGELSRIMLALKNVLTAGEDVGMLIFDEIDTGVSGHAAQQIARKLSAIAKKKQTLCVTHLPQIAAMGDHHLRISKTVREGRSYTDVSPMDRAHRVDEIARLLSGEQISEAARRNAEELLEAAGQGG